MALAVEIFSGKVVMVHLSGEMTIAGVLVLGRNAVSAVAILLAPP
jgi:hypothetical protein